jgi:mitochondrial ornithine carrier protein
MVLSVFETAAVFFAYDELQVLIRKFSGMKKNEGLSLAQLSVAAAGAGAITTFLTYVLDCLCTQLCLLYYPVPH